MVALIREIGNKFFLSSTNMNSTTTMALPTVNASIYIEMDFENVVKNTSDNYDEMRGWTTTPNKQFSRASSISSTVSLVTYHK